MRRSPRRARRRSAHHRRQVSPVVARLHALWATERSPEGRPWTLTAVSKATGLSVPYLSLLRQGVIGEVPFPRVVTLARFFGVSLDVFSPAGAPTAPLDDQVRGALAQPLVRELVLRVARLSLPERALIVQLLEHLVRVADALAVRPAVPPTPAPPCRRDVR